MSEFTLSKIYTSDHVTNQQVDMLLSQEGITRDKHLDYTCGVFLDQQLVATGSCLGNTLRCLAVHRDYQGEGLMNILISHLIAFQYERDHLHLFVYTKRIAAKFFSDLGFFEIARVDETLVFMENRKNGFQDYLQSLQATNTKKGKVASIVMNANPFSLGHQYLVQEASKENDLVHLFMVSEDSSLIPYAVRKQLIIEGTAHLPNIQYHETGSYIISSATFPSYFLKDDETVIRTQAALDIAIFIKIANSLGIHTRYLGEEPFSEVTSIYNSLMKERLTAAGICCTILPRLAVDQLPISASAIRLAIKEERLDEVKQLVPATTFAFFESSLGKEIIQKIKDSDNVIHY